MANLQCCKLTIRRASPAASRLAGAPWSSWCLGRFLRSRGRPAREWGALINETTWRRLREGHVTRQASIADLMGLMSRLAVIVAVVAGDVRAELGHAIAVGRSETIATAH